MGAWYTIGLCLGIGLGIGVVLVGVLGSNLLGVGAGASRGTRHEHDGASGTTALGGGVTIQPMGFIVVDAAGRAHLLSLDAAKESPLLRAVEMLPEVASKLEASGERLLEKTSTPKS